MSTLKQTKSRAMELRGSGLSWDDVATKLHEEGYTTPRGKPFTGGNAWNLVNQVEVRFQGKKQKQQTNTGSTSKGSKDEIISAVLKSKDFSDKDKIALCQLVLDK